MSASFRLAAVSLTLVLGLVPSWLQAQRSSASRPSSSPVLIQGRGSVAPARGEAAQTAPPSLSPGAQLALARLAAGPAVTVSGIGAKLRLTPGRPFTANQAELRTSMALAVHPQHEGGVITLQPDVVGTSGGPTVEVRFRPSLVNRPVLVDFVMKVSTVNAPVGVYLGGHGVKEHRTLPGGDHHVTALVLPGDTGWYTVSLSVLRTSAYQRVWIYAVDLTTLN
jgi:hypothetical protein